MLTHPSSQPNLERPRRVAALFNKGPHDAGEGPKWFPNIWKAFFILRTGTPWRELPSKFGQWSTICSQFRRRCLCGPWDALPAWLAPGQTPSLRHVDGSSISTGGKGAKKNCDAEVVGLSRGDMRTKPLAALEETGNRCAFVLTPDNLHDQTAARQIIDAFATFIFGR
jgi:hypothetical protein